MCRSPTGSPRGRPAAAGANAVFVTPDSAPGAADIVATVRAHEAAAGREAPPLRVFADLVVFLDADARTAAARKDHLDELFGHVLRSDARVFVRTPSELVDLLV